MAKSREMEKEQEVSLKPIQDKKQSGSTDDVSEKEKAIPPPFPTCIQMSNKAREEKEILETFIKVEVNIPLLDAVKQVPRYAKFLKELCTNKRKLMGNETINMNENVFSVLQKKLPPKCKDPGVFTIPCKLGNVTINRAMLDLGASINVMPFSIFKTLNVGPLQETRVVIQLADRSLVHPKGAPELKLKKLPEHLKYAYLGEGEKLLVIISSRLDSSEEKKLVSMLKQFKEAIGWTIADIKGLRPSTCMHKILMEDDFKPFGEAQRRLNLPMMEVVKKEIQKLLDAGVIFAISDSKWVSPVQVVPKKVGVTVVENAGGVMVPTRVQSGWRVCIDYRRLNASTRKDHFPLPLIDQMFERLAGTKVIVSTDHAVLRHLMAKKDAKPRLI
ncbi:uncharacterized protein LOC112505966 [Cynara cardunculus var. scolymus]|uniref:uncharacterized protein LOC112505966 n=1 Tax=Cynara cardunculus var. scolymus TaxID=59895 RepID=UPI000D62EFC5|nr:uncharacterized protein LOC112505966 [Cynara cardunculus var. scolymus]